MNISNIFAKLLSMILVAVALSACTSATKVKSDLGIKGAPDWVNQGSNILNNKDGRLFHGVGSASAMGDKALQKSVADDRARAELARILSSYMDVVSSDYLAYTKSGDANVTEEAVSRQIKALTRVNLAGARIIGNWHDPKTSIIYSIAELDMKQVKSTLAVTQGMNEDLRRYIETSANNIFDRIAKEKK
ncbi:MAG: hypothetical protein OEV15_08935 [Gallionella sp.]|nr:hypothetical protein [Gallionella sp.]